MIKKLFTTLFLSSLFFSNTLFVFAQKPAEQPKEENAPKCKIKETHFTSMTKEGNLGLLSRAQAKKMFEFQENSSLKASVYLMITTENCTGKNIHVTVVDGWHKEAILGEFSKPRKVDSEKKGIQINLARGGCHANVPEKVYQSGELIRKNGGESIFESPSTVHGGDLGRMNFEDKNAFLKMMPNTYMRAIAAMGGRFREDYNELEEIQKLQDALEGKARIIAPGMGFCNYRSIAVIEELYQEQKKKNNIPNFMQGIIKFPSKHSGEGAVSKAFGYGDIMSKLSPGEWTSTGDYSGAAVELNQAATLDTQSPCYSEKTASMITDCIALLAPIPKIADNVFKASDGTLMGSVNIAGWSLGKLINSWFEIAIGILGLLLVLSLIYRGFSLMTAATVSQKLESKIGWTDCIIGLAIALGAYLLLKTINPHLLEIEPQIDLVALEGESGIDDYFKDGGKIVSVGNVKGIPGQKRDPGNLTAGNISEKEKIANAVPKNTLMSLSSLGLSIKSGASSEVDSILAKKLQNFDKEVRAAGIKNTKVTEAFKPKYWKHVSLCHYKGTCIDYDIGEDEKNPAKVKQVIEIALKNKLLPVFEMPTQNELKPYFDAGLSKPYLCRAGTGGHFSIYDIVQ
jgi:hypothetical protein